MNLKYIILSNPYKDSLSVLRPILEMTKLKWNQKPALVAPLSSWEIGLFGPFSSNTPPYSHPGRAEPFPTSHQFPGVSGI